MSFGHNFAGERYIVYSQIMPKFKNDYSDDRWKQWCVHCCRNLADVTVNKDHVPSKGLLNKPYPDNMSITYVCEPCNTSFSLDEEYMIAFISVVLSGTTEPEKQRSLRGKEILSRNEGLRRRIAASQTSGPNAVWMPEIERIQSVVIKNARGHALYEAGEAKMEEPISAFIKPICTMSQQEIDEFVGASTMEVWPEVGSRWMQRVVEGDNFDNIGFLVVQPDIYSFQIGTSNGLSIKSVIHNYLATEVVWD